MHRNFTFFTLWETAEVNVEGDVGIRLLLMLLWLLSNGNVCVYVCVYMCVKEQDQM